MNNVLSFFLFLTTSTTALASADLSTFYVGGKGLHSVYESSQEKDAVGIEGRLGVEWRYLQAELGLASLALGKDESINPFVFRVKSAFEVAPDTRLYVGGGGAAIDGTVRPEVSAGLMYQMTPSWSVDAGYQMLLNAPSLNDDVVSFGLGIVYRPLVDAVKVIPDEEVLPSPSDLFTPEVDVIPVPVCEVVTNSHVVVEGDYLIKIAHRYQMPLLQLLSLNERRLSERNIDLIYPGEVIYYQTFECK